MVQVLYSPVCYLFWHGNGPWSRLYTHLCVICLLEVFISCLSSCTSSFDCNTVLCVCTTHLCALPNTVKLLSAGICRDMFCIQYECWTLLFHCRQFMLSWNDYTFLKMISFIKKRKYSTKWEEKRLAQSNKPIHWQGGRTPRLVVRDVQHCSTLWLGRAVAIQAAPFLQVFIICHHIHLWMWIFYNYLQKRVPWFCLLHPCFCLCDGYQLPLYYKCTASGQTGHLCYTSSKT